MNGPAHYLLLFADLVGSTDVAVEASPNFYSETYVASYHWAATCAHRFMQVADAFPEVQFHQTLDLPQIAGDEVLSFTRMPTGNPTLQEDLVASAVAFAYVTKLFWLVSPYNLQRIRNKQFPRDVAVGIHVGPAVAVPPAPVGHEQGQIASLHINTAKRIEQIAREGKESRIFVSYEVRDLFRQWVKRHGDIEDKKKPALLYAEFQKRDNPQLVKGIPKPLQLFELEWVKDDRRLITYLLNELHRTLDEDDVQLEKAARQAIEIFLPPARRPVFASEDGRESVKAPFETAAEHIGAWFEGVESVSKLFFDEYWLVITSYLACCGMLRHPDVDKTKRDKYKKVAEVVFKRLEMLADERRENQRREGH